MSSAPRWRAVFGSIFAVTYAAAAPAGCRAPSPAVSDSGTPSDGPNPSTRARDREAGDGSFASGRSDPRRAPAPTGSGLARFSVATRIAGTSGYVRERRATGVIVGERWGCAQIASEGPAMWQCWEANSPQSSEHQALRAFAVPWLHGQYDLMAAADHLCGYERPELALRCWKRPSLRESAGRSLPERDEWLNPHHTPYDENERPDWPERAFVGGTFACLRSVVGEVWCVGNNAFWQLGSAAGRKRGSPSYTPPFLGVWPAQGVALGTWHGCAIAAPKGLGAEFYASCWGRGDLGQLGGPAPDVCAVNGQPVRCARSPQRNIVLTGGIEALGAGDQFTCLTDPEGIRCWGASRDGFFGAPGSCPKAVEREWPTMGEPINAPHARCSPVPAAVPIGHGYQPNFSVGPRGLCVPEESKVHCAGAILAPRLDGVQNVKVSAGQDASACTVRDGSVLCWGEGYSQPNALDVPVAIALASPPGGAEAAVLGATDPAGWDANCLVRTKCTASAAPLGACGPEVHPRDWSEVLSSASKSTGRRISVRGRLGVGLVSGTLAGCPGSGGRGCCNRTGGPVVLGGASEVLALGGFFCSGDDSQSCCNAPAYGQFVVATGELVPGDSTGSGINWTLANAALCLESDGGS